MRTERFEGALLSALVIALIVAPTLASVSAPATQGVQTGELDWEFVAVDALDPDNGALDYHCRDGFEGPPPYYWMGDKDVGSTTATITDPDNVTVTLYNVYPGYFNMVSVYALNTGTIPLIIDSVIIDGIVLGSFPTYPIQLDLDNDQLYDIEIWWRDGFGEQLEPGDDSPEMSFWIHVLQDIPQGETLNSTIEIVAVQWNMYPMASLGLVPLYWSVSLKIDLILQTMPDLTISPSYREGLPGETLTYTVTVPNLGTENDTYELLVSDNAGWSPNISPSTLALAAGASGQATLSVTIPKNILPSIEDEITVTATSTENADITDNDSCIARISLVLLIERYFPVLKFSKDEEYYPCSFYFDGDNYIDNNRVNYDNREGIWDEKYAYVHTAVDEEKFGIQYWFYYAYDNGSPGLGGILRPYNFHLHDWEQIVVVFDKSDLSKPAEVGWSRHGRVIYHDWNFAEKEGGRYPISYVAKDKHANYPRRLSLLPGYRWSMGDEWEKGGDILYPEGFNWYLANNVKECLYFPYDIFRSGEHYIKYEQYDLLDVQLLHGVEQPETAGSTWPGDFRDRKAPWNPHWDFEEWNQPRPNPHSGIFDWQRWLVWSPVDVHIYDSENRHVGVNYETRIIENEIPNVIFYFDDEGHQHMGLDPSRDNYRIEVRGIENGAYTSETARQENGEWIYWSRQENILIMENEKQSIHLDYACIISPRKLVGQPSVTLNYSITLTNLGNIKDTYTLAAEDNAGWELAVSPPSFENVLPGENRTATLTVTIPENAVAGTFNDVTVTATGTRLSTTVVCTSILPKVELSLANLYKLSLDTGLYFENGSKLVVKFFTYGDTYDNEHVVWSGMMPASVFLLENVPHPEGKPIKIVRLDLTTDNTENVISTIANFTVQKVDLEVRFTEIPLEWALASPAEKTALEMEFSEIPFYWALAPS